jgi:predicted nucleic acid-binding protein
MRGKIRVFFDTSALFAGVWSPAGGARDVLRLAELGAIQLWVSSLVLEELERALQRKAPQALLWLAMLLHRIDVQLASAPASEALEATRRLVQHPGDAHILASAWSSEVDYFVTLDRQHLLENAALREEVPFPIGTPGDLLAWLRQRWEAGESR